MMNERIEALVNFLGCEEEEVNTVTWSDTVFEVDGCEYNVLTDEEAASYQILEGNSDEAGEE